MLTPSGAFLATLWQTVFNDIAGNRYGQALDTLLQPLLQAEGVLHTLPLLVARAYRQPPESVEPLKAAWSCIYRAAKMFDDIEDGDNPLALTEAINQGLGLLWVAHALLENESLHRSPSVRLAVLNKLHPALLRATAGQQADVEYAQSETPYCTPDEWVTIAAAKSGELVGWVTWASAWVLTENSDHADAFADFGNHLGILLQVVDDFEGVWGANGKDLAQPALTLPVCYAMMVSPAEGQQHLRGLLAQAWQGDTHAQQTLRTGLETIGAREFLWTVAHHHAQRAKNALAPIADIDTAPLSHLLKTVFPLLP
jgi:geranylgeranyl pyrophosphate synthase